MTEFARTNVVICNNCCCWLLIVVAADPLLHVPLTIHSIYHLRLKVKRIFSNRLEV